MDLQDMKIFARVAAVQNLSAVGSELGLTPGTISKRIQALEDDLSVRLFDRTTRSIRITEEGTIFLTHIERVLAEIETARATVADKVGQAKGRIRIVIPTSLARAQFVPAMFAFLDSYKDIAVQIDMSDRAVNVQEDGYDLAIHIGDLADSALKAKRLHTGTLVLAAAPAYLERAGTPRTIQDLAQHECLATGEASIWTFRCQRSGDKSIRVSSRFTCESTAVLAHAAISGHGIVRAGDFMIRAELASGKLVRLLPEYETPGGWNIHALYPSSKYMLPRLRVLLDFLAEWFRVPVGENGAHAAPSRLGLTMDGASV
jgi:DNA-binding transcriptional LysR family regulator